MENNQVPKIIQPSKYAIKYMLATYKAGFLIFTKKHNSAFVLRCLEWLYENNYLENALERADSYSSHKLTEKGSKFIEDNFLSILTASPLHYIHPIVIPGDRVNCCKNSRKRFDHLIPDGDYVIQRISQYYCTVKSESLNKVYRINTYHYRDFLKLLFQDNLDVKKECNKRIGKVNVKQMAKLLVKLVPNKLQYFNLINQFQNLSYVKDRIRGIKNGN